MKHSTPFKCGFGRPSLIKHPMFEEVRRLLCTPLLGVIVIIFSIIIVICFLLVGIMLDNVHGEQVRRLLCTSLGASTSPSLIVHPQKCGHTLLERPSLNQSFRVRNLSNPGSHFLFLRFLNKGLHRIKVPQCQAEGVPSVAKKSEKNQKL